MILELAKVTMRIRILAIVLASAGNAALAGACSQNDTAEYEELGEMPAKSIEQVLQEHTEEWLSIPGVVGTAIGACDGEPCIRILAAERTTELLERIPPAIDGYPVDVQVSGPIRALEPDSQQAGSEDGAAE